MNLSRITPKPSWIYGDYMSGLEHDQIAEMYDITVEQTRAMLMQEKRRCKYTTPVRSHTRKQEVWVDKTDGMYRLRHVCGACGYNHRQGELSAKRIDASELKQMSCSTDGRNFYNYTYVTLRGIQQWHDRLKYNTAGKERLARFIRREGGEV